MNMLGNILMERMKNYSIDPKGVEQAIKARGIEYSKQWNKGVQHFQQAINKDRAKAGLKPLGFMPIRMKLIALREINDLRWFFFHCQKYGKTKDKDGNWNSFSKCFFGALDTKKAR